MSDHTLAVQPYTAPCPTGHDAEWTTTQHAAGYLGLGGSMRATFVCPSCLDLPKDI